ncbi:MAG: cytochrome c oxidase subunit 3 [Armatimonadetes bacterium]|nr:cytochrome c oxidase subunit 3 [Armatimonadota bacterium]
MSTTMANSDHGHADGVFHQYENIDQQNESYIVGMWTFLVTEVMFFGPLFFTYILYRWQYQEYFWRTHQLLDIKLGGINTMILLASSFSMAMGVHYAQKKDTKRQLGMMGFTVLCGAAFLAIKLALEWAPKFQHHMIPGPQFTWPPHDGYDQSILALLHDVPRGAAEMYFSIYFGITGLHGIHVVVGMLCIAIIMFMKVRKFPQVESYIPTEMVGLYWHFVDLVWIFLYPLFYLMPR